MPTTDDAAVYRRRDDLAVVVTTDFFASERAEVLLEACRDRSTLAASVIGTIRADPGSGSWIMVNN